MTAYDWLESHKVIRFAALTVLFLIASEALFGTVAVWILAGLPGRPGVFGDVVLPLAALLIANRLQFSYSQDRSSASSEAIHIDHCASFSCSLPWDGFSFRCDDTRELA